MNRPPLLIPRLDAVPPRPPLRERMHQSFTGLGHLLAGLFHLTLAAGAFWLACGVLAHVSFLQPLFNTGAALLHELTETLFH